MNTKVIRKNDTLNNFIDENNQTLYIIKGECFLTADVTLASDSILRFEVDTSDEDNVT